MGLTPRYVEEIPDPAPIETTRYDLHQYDCSACGTTVQAAHPDCSAEGRFGPQVPALAARERYEDRLPYRKIDDRFDQLFDLYMSENSAWHATERVARASRSEYARLQAQIRDADIVHVDEIGFMIDDHQTWLQTFRPEEHAEVAPIADRLHRLYDGLANFLSTDSAPAARDRMRRRARQTLEEPIAQPVETAEVAKFLWRNESGLDYSLPFVTQPEVKPINDAAENVLYEPVVLRKIIGTLRTESGRVAHETLMSLVATW